METMQQTTEMDEVVAPEESAQEVPQEEVQEVSQEDEVARLREQVASLTAELAAGKRAGQEYAAFVELFPGVTPERVPDAVWRQVQSGVPLAAAYALYEKKQERMAKLAEETEARGTAISPGAVGAAGEEYFSPARVRAMSEREVHENYARICESMRHWQ